jgi:hypothetical protein
VKGTQSGGEIARCKRTKAILDGEVFRAFSRHFHEDKAWMSLGGLMAMIAEKLQTGSPQTPIELVVPNWPMSRRLRITTWAMPRADQSCFVGNTGQGCVFAPQGLVWKRLRCTRPILIEARCPIMLHIHGRALQTVSYIVCPPASSLMVFWPAHKVIECPE